MGKIKLNTKNNLKTIDEAFEEFQKFNKIKDLSEWTIVSYEGSYKVFTKYYYGENLCCSLNLQIINEFIAYLKEERKVNNISINTYLANMRAFINYCSRMGYIEGFKITQLKAIKEVKETYNDNELAILLKRPDIKKCSFSEYRNWVFINYLIATGNRVSTVINVKIGDIDFDNNTIILKKTKNRNQQIIPISNSLKVILLEYLKYRKGDNEDYLFCNSIGKKSSRDSITQSIRQYNRVRGISKTSIHLFRHTFAKNWILNGGDVFRLQKLLGHKSMEIVKEYVNMFNNDLQKNFNDFNPLERFSKINKTISMKNI